jgi:hypothetical protein
MPNLSADQDFRQKVKARAYKVAERGGLVYVYMGERDVAPPLPALEAMLCPPDETNLLARQRECNWLQALEGDIDTSHFSFLHTGKVTIDDVDPDHLERFQFTDRAPRFHARPTDWGTMYAAYRPAQSGHTYYRFAHFVFPFWTLFPNGPLTDNVLAQGWVPMDDTHIMAFTFSWTRKTPVLSLNKRGEPLPLLDRVSPTLPNTADWFGRWRPVANQSNDYLIDREAQRTISYTGIAGVFPQDSAVTESMGDISDPYPRKSRAQRPDDRDDAAALARGRSRIAGQGDGSPRRRRSRHRRPGAFGRSDRTRWPAVARGLRADTRAGAAPGHGARGRVNPVRA